MAPNRIYLVIVFPIFHIDAEDEDELLNEKSPEEDECDENEADDDDSPVLGSALTPPDSPPFQDVWPKNPQCGDLRIFYHKLYKDEVKASLC